MQVNKYLYSYGYDTYESALCKLESKCLFSKEEKNKILFSDIKADPSTSAFIKKRLEIISFSDDYDGLIREVKKEGLSLQGFKIEYLILEGDTIVYDERLKKMRAIAYCIEGMPDYYNPIITYGICHYAGVWYFGVLVKNSFAWHQHKQKPHSYSNSISAGIAKALVNIAAIANKEKTLLDACCGAGTIMLEACFAGNNITGCDLNAKMCLAARENLSHFNYMATVQHSDIKDINERYDTAIVDLPYNLFTSATDDDIIHIIEATAKITNRMVIVSNADITNLINNQGFKILDYCTVGKRGKTNFAREIWVCEKE